MSEVEIDTKAVDSTLAQKQLQDLYERHIISQKRMDELKEKYTRLSDIVMKCISNDKALIKKARELKQDLMNENLTLEKTNSQQKDNEETMKQLNQTIENAATEMKQIDDRIKLSDFQISILEKQKSEYDDTLEAKKNEVKKNLNIEISQLNKDIEDNVAEIEKYTQKSDKQTKAIELHEKGITQQKKKIEELHEGIDIQQDLYSKLKDDPIRIAKTIGIMNKAVEKNQIELDTLASSISSIKQLKEDKEKLIKDFSARLDTFAQQDKEIEDLTSKAKEDLRTRLVSKDEQEKRISGFREKQKNNEAIIELLVKDKSKKQTMLTSQNKEYESNKKTFKKIEYALQNLGTTIKELETQEGKLGQKLEEQRKDLNEQKKINENLDDENTLFTESLVKKEDLDCATAKKIQEFEAEKQQKEQVLSELKLKEIQAHETIKQLTITREKMARTASQANDQVRQKKEEMKVKDLLINDLIKKEQETKFNLDHLIVLYEQVKNARNKFVNLIQNCSQNLAEQKERIKILQNEYEILRNESAEKDHSLVEARHKLQKQRYIRDNKKAELEKLKKEHKELDSLTEQKITEQGKLSLVFATIEKEVKSLIERYEMACESRNMMGINLIDRNDELCILYEKANIQDSILKKGENSIHQKEEEIRMLNLELNERQRQILVLRKQIPEVPKLAREVNDLKTELDHERQLVAQLSEEIENPKANKDGHSRITKLESEIPDQDTLKAKIQVLEERLNSKKEALLEKELVLEEISNITEKMRQQTIDGRKSILELGEKINEFKAKTSELSRQMLATVAELSMYQASALKLEQEKCERENVLTEATDRFSKGMPPTEEDEEEWKRRLRQEEQKDAILKSLAAQKEEQNQTLQVKTTAKPRPTTYISQVTGLFEHYGGMYPSFLPSEEGANMRHIRKPQPKDIEI